MNDQIFDSIVDIELSENAEAAQQEAMFITDLSTATEFEHPARIAILTIMRRGIPDTSTTESVDERTRERVIIQKPITRNALSVREIVNISKEYADIERLTRNVVNHHLPRMVEMGFVRRYGKLRTGKRTTDYYQRVAKQYVLTMETPHFGAEFLLTRETLRIDRTLQTFKIDLDESEKKELIDLLVKCELLKDKWRKDIAALIRDDITEPEVVNMYHWLLDAYATGSKEYIQLFNRIREILFKDGLGMV
ncbi:MAG: hypothetical protein ACXADS_15195 [Candidatus Thorarchaeota archaeon]